MNMTKKRIILIAIVAAVLIAGTVAGVQMYRNRFDAGEYVQAVLDVSYKNKPELYVEITGAEEEAAKQVFEDNLDATMQGFEGTGMPDELLGQYRELFAELAKNVSYTVGQPVKEENGMYEVLVRVKPITLLPDTYNTFQKKAQEYADQVTDSVMDGADMPSDEEMQKEIYQIYYDVLRDKMDTGMLYGEVKNITLQVKKEGSREFRILQEDMDRLDALLIEDAQAE